MNECYIALGGITNPAREWAEDKCKISLQKHEQTISGREPKNNYQMLFFSSEFTNASIDKSHTVQKANIRRISGPSADATFILSWRRIENETQELCNAE